MYLGIKKNSKSFGKFLQNKFNYEREKKRRNIKWRKIILRSQLSGSVVNETKQNDNDL